MTEAEAIPIVAHIISGWEWADDSAAQAAEKGVSCSARRGKLQWEPTLPLCRRISG